MSHITLKEEAWEEGTFTYHDGQQVTIEYLYKEKLSATKCDCCGSVFETPRQHGDAKLMLIMDKCPSNHTEAIFLDICSVECGKKLVEGDWKQTKIDPMDEDGGHPFVNIGAVVKDFRINTRTDLASRADLIEQWERSGHRPAIIKRREEGYIGISAGRGRRVTIGPQL